MSVKTYKTVGDMEKPKSKPRKKSWVKRVDESGPHLPKPVRDFLMGPYWVEAKEKARNKKTKGGKAKR